MNSKENELLNQNNNMSKKYNDRVSFRLSKIDRELLEQTAEEKSLSLAQLLRQLTDVKKVNVKYI